MYIPWRKYCEDANREAVKFRLCYEKGQQFKGRDLNLSCGVENGFCRRLQKM